MTLFHFFVKKIEPLSDPAEMSGWGRGGGCSESPMNPTRPRPFKENGHGVVIVLSILILCKIHTLRGIEWS